MLNYIWAAIIAISILSGFFRQNLDQVTLSVITGGRQTLDLFLSVGGAIIVWSGIMRIAEEAGLAEGLAKLLSPFLARLFPDLPPHSKAKSYIGMNMAANLLGLGNAATPLGLAAMEEMKRSQVDPTCASDSMVRFVIMNTACVQLIPSTVGAIRARYGCATPMDIVPGVLLASLCALCTGIIFSYLLAGKEGLR